MATINTSDDGNNPAPKAGSNPGPPSLSELIAEIDRETGQLAVPEYSLEAKFQEPAEISTDVRSQFILFALEKTIFALPLASALEIGHRPEITRLPYLPSWVLGISNVRGEIISLVDLKAFLEFPSSGAIGDNRLIIVYNQSMKLGIIVEKILGMISLDQIDSNIKESPYREGEIANFIAGAAFYEDNFVSILDIDKLLSCPRMNSFRGGQRQ